MCTRLSVGIGSNRIGFGGGRSARRRRVSFLGRRRVSCVVCRVCALRSAVLRAPRSAASGPPDHATAFILRTDCHPYTPRPPRYCAGRAALRPACRSTPSRLFSHARALASAIHWLGRPPQKHRARRRSGVRDECVTHTLQPGNTSGDERVGDSARAPRQCARCVCEPWAAPPEVHPAGASGLNAAHTSVMSTCAESVRTGVPPVTAYGTPG